MILTAAGDSGTIAPAWGRSRRHAPPEFGPSMHGGGRRTLGEGRTVDGRNDRARAALDGDDLSALGALRGECPAIVSVRKEVEQFLRRQSSSRRPAPVLVLGETGTGKGLLA